LLQPNGAAKNLSTIAIHNGCFVSLWRQSSNFSNELILHLALESHQPSSTSAVSRRTQQSNRTPERQQQAAQQQQQTPSLPSDFLVSLSDLNRCELILIESISNNSGSNGGTGVSGVNQANEDSVSKNATKNNNANNTNKTKQQDHSTRTGNFLVRSHPPAASDRLLAFGGFQKQKEEMLQFFSDVFDRPQQLILSSMNMKRKRK
jgi:hypothetical protein